MGHKRKDGVLLHGEMKAVLKGPEIHAKVLGVPFKNSREPNFFSSGLDFIPPGIVDKIARGEEELAFNARTGEGLPPKFRAACGRAAKRHINLFVVKDLDQIAQANIIGAVGTATHADDRGIPGPWDILDAADRIMLDDELDEARVVGIQPKG